MPSLLPRVFEIPVILLNRRMVRTAGAMIAVMLIASSPTGHAQTVIGGSTPSVHVDLGVLDSLGPAPTLPELLRRPSASAKSAIGATASPRSSQRVTLHSPNTSSKTKTKGSGKRAAQASPKPTAKTTAHEKTVALTKPTKVSPAQPKAPVNAAPVATAAAPSAEPAAPAVPVAASPLRQEPAAAAQPSPATAPVGPGPRIAAAAALTATSPPPSGMAASPAAVAAGPSPATAVPAQPPTATPAAAPAAAATAAAGANRIVFAAGAADVPDAAKRDLDALAQRLAAGQQLRVQLVSYASGSAEEANQARRLSLQRALAVRSYLIEHGVSNSRMDVRALGNRNDGSEPSDRVDLVILDR
ncbi:MAG TPA: OmpA family protein [Stellaceae bacterium]|nr:OmpA family protein [Stellaceae bacterium]